MLGLIIIFDVFCQLPWRLWFELPSSLLFTIEYCSMMTTFDEDYLCSMQIARL